MRPTSKDDRNGAIKSTNLINTQIVVVTMKMSIFIGVKLGKKSRIIDGLTQ